MSGLLPENYVVTSNLALNLAPLAVADFNLSEIVQARDAAAPGGAVCNNPIWWAGAAGRAMDSARVQRPQRLRGVGRARYRGWLSAGNAGLSLAPTLLRCRLAPEVLLGEEATTAGDVYSFAMVRRRPLL